MAIHFTQYKLPFGRQEEITIDRPEEIETMARDITMRGYKFEIEVLTTGIVSMTVTDPDDDGGDVAMELCQNNEQVLVKVDKLVTNFHQKMFKEDLWAKTGDEE